MPLGKAAPFDHPEFLFELKYDGFRAIAVAEHGRCTLYSRNGNAFASFSALAAGVADHLMFCRVVLDGEIVCLDRNGCPQFNELLFRRGEPRFVAFDLLFLNGKDVRPERLIDRKMELRRLLGQAESPVVYADHIDAAGVALFKKACEYDLEGVVAKHKHSPYAPNAQTTWFKIRNRSYSQWAGRHELFERERHQEPVPGWHACTFAAEQQESRTVRPSWPSRPRKAPLRNRRLIEDLGWGKVPSAPRTPTTPLA